MKLEDQVCSLDLAKRLKELEVKQESHFYWCRLGTGECITENVNLKVKVHGKHWHSAFTVAELGEMLPPVITKKSGEDHYLMLTKLEGGNWSLCYERTGYRHEEIPFLEGNTEAGARAKMLIYLLENKLIT